MRIKGSIAKCTDSKCGKIIFSKEDEKDGKKKKEEN